MKKHPKILRTVCISLTAVATSVAGTEVSARQLEEVLVTATKREAGMQDIPIAITSLSGATLESKNILSAQALENYTPGLRIPQQDAAKTFVRIRGVGSRKFDIGSEGSVGIFVDELYLPRFSSADIGFLDVERVEVLKGPQGTLLGRNTAAGAINVTNRRPTKEPEGYLEGGLGDENSYLLRGAVSGPVAETVAMRLALGVSEDGGQQKNTLSGNTDDRETFASRWQTSWEASDSIDVGVGLHYAKREQKALLQKNTPIDDNGTILPILGAPGMVFTANDDLREYPISEDGRFTGESFTASVRLEKQLAHASLVSITGYQQTRDEILQDFDANDANVGVEGTDTEADTLSQEFRLVGDNYLGGIYFYKDSAESDFAFNWDADSLPVFLTQGDEAVDSGTTDIETSSWAIFGEYTFDLGETISLTLGGRYSYDQKDFELAASTTQPGLPAILEPYVYADKADWDSVDPKIAITWEPEDDLLLFLTYNEGYKSGGVQFTAINEAIAQQLFDPEELSAYELGVKTQLLDDTLRVNASAFLYEYDDLQVQRVETEVSGGIPVAFTDNAARSDITGAEIDAVWLLPAGFSTRLAYAYLDAKYKDYTGTGGEDFSGNPLPVSPEHTVMFSLDYQVALANDWQLMAGTDWTWVDDYNFDVDDRDLQTRQDAYALGAATLALMSPTGRWTLSAFVQNLTDEDYYSQRTRRETEIIGSAGQGRRYGVRMKYVF